MFRRQGYIYFHTDSGADYLTTQRPVHFPKVHDPQYEKDLSKVIRGHHLLYLSKEANILLFVVITLEDKNVCDQMIVSGTLPGQH